MTSSPDESTQESTKSPRKRGRGKARSFDFSAIEHVGNDATEGGFLGDDAAESERRGTPTAVAAPPTLTLDYDSPGPSQREETNSNPASEVRLPAQDGAEASPASVAPGASRVVPSPSQPTEDGTTPQDPAESSSEPEADVPDASPAAEPAEEAEEAEEADGAEAPPKPSATGRRRNDGPGFTAASAEPTLKPRPRRKAASTKPPMQTAVLGSFIKHRTERNWPTWSGRIEGETKSRLLQKADDDAESSGRNLMPGHYLDAALRLVKDLSPEELAAIANEWLIDKWSGEHPPGVSIQAGVSPDMYQFLKGLKRHLRGQRGAGSGGLILDVVSAAVDRFLDAADDEGPFPPAR
ncbi:hypothetical protein ACN6AT_38335 (plasmid) [Streptomyces sp. JL4002]|uniref:hypothetical protein n=1 Tax=Streptomyces sp. JL4002 TaxID=3404781 RepID=UPI003B284D29